MQLGLSRPFSTKEFGIPRSDDDPVRIAKSTTLFTSLSVAERDTHSMAEQRESVTASMLNETESPVGFMTYERRLEAESALLSWTDERSPEGFHNSMTLLVRLIQEQEGQPLAADGDAYRVRSFLANRVVDCWRICWCGGENVLEPSALLTTLQDLDVTIDSRALTMVIDAMLKRGNPLETSMVAQWILDQRMEDAYENPEVRPDSFLLTSVIRAWAKSGRIEGPEMAEAILSLMHDLHENGWEDSRPNLISYGAVMDAWNQSRHPDGPHAIDRLLNRMKEMENSELQPDSLIYSLAIDAWSRSGTLHSTKKAHERLNEMIGLSTNGNQRVSPTADNFARVMHAMAKNGDGQQATLLYKQLEDLYKTTGNAHLKPNPECRKALLSALSKRGTSRQATEVLEGLIEDAVARGGIMPRRSYFIDVLVALTKENNPFTAATESEKLLRRMVDLAQSGFPDLMPDSLSFLKVARTWSKCREKVAVSKVAALVELLEDLHERTGSGALKPSASLMEVAVLTLCRSPLPDALERAEAIVSKMEKVYSDGDRTMKPSRGIYTSLMQAWARRDDPRSHFVVQAIFDKLNVLYSQGHKDYRPDVVVCSTLMGSIAQRGDSPKVQLLFDALCDDYRTGNSSEKPDMHTFNMILKAWSYSDNPNRGQKAEAALNRIPEINKLTGLDLKPDAYTFIHMIRIWSGSDLPENAERAEHYLRSMLSNSFDVSFNFGYDVLRLWIQKGDNASTGRASILLEDIIAGIQTNKIRFPNATLYREFLQLVANSKIGGRHIQARKLLLSLPDHKVLRSLMPPDYRERHAQRS